MSPWVMLMRILSVRPDIIPVLIEPSTDNNGAGRPSQALADLFLPPFAATLLQFGKGMEFLTSPLEIYYGNAANPGGSQPVNQCITSFQVEAGVPDTRWVGPVLVMKFASHARDKYIDFEQSDIEHVREYFVLLES